MRFFATDYREVSSTRPSQPLVYDLHSGRMLSPPLILILESTTRCNLSCAFCGHELLERTGRLEVGDMSMELFEKLVPFIKPAVIVSLTSFGEPFLCRDLLEMARRIKHYGTQVIITTNGTIMDLETAAAIVDSGIDFLEFSLEGVHTNERVRGVSAERVLENVRMVADAKNARGAKDPQLFIASILMTSNLEELPATVARAAGAGAQEFRVQPLQVFFGALEHENPYLDTGRCEAALKAAAETAREADIAFRVRRSMFAMDERYDEKRTYLSSYDHRYYCVEPFSRMIVDRYGNVGMCCGGLRTYTNVNRQGLWDIWNCTAFRKIRLALVAGDIPERCRTCNQIASSLENQVKIFTQPKWQFLTSSTVGNVLKKVMGHMPLAEKVLGILHEL